METARGSREKWIFAAVVAGLIVFNSVTLLEAYPESLNTGSGCCGDRPLAKDFSAFYTAAWRLFNDPSHVYTPGLVDDGGYQVLPQPETYKYVPSFLFMVLPFLLLGYHQALAAFDLFQFFLLPLLALLIFELTKRRGLSVSVAVAVAVLAFPLPWPHWGLSVPYYWQWAEGQSKVLETFLLLLSFYLGMRRRSTLSGVVFAFAVFDPRFALFAAPLFVMYNKDGLRRAAAAAAVAFVVSNSALLYPGTGAGFISMIVDSGLSTPLYYYAYIPLAAVIALSVLNAGEIWRVFGDLGRRVKL